MSERKIVWLLPRVSEAAYARYLADFGIRTCAHDPVKLAAALSWPRTVAAFSDGVPSMSQIAAAHAAAIVRLRPFEEGNGAMACLLTMLFLRLNSIDLPAPVMEKYLVFAGLDDGRLDTSGLAQWMRLRHHANRRGAQWVVEVNIHDGKVQSVAGLNAVDHRKTRTATASHLPRASKDAPP